ncbi:MAG: TonB-dependent receptor [Methylotetracoccus sp.]
MLRRGVLIIAVAVRTVMADDVCEEAGRLVSVDGSVDVQSSGQRSWHSAEFDQRLCQGDTLHVNAGSRAAVKLINSAVLRLGADTTLTLRNVVNRPDDWSWLDLGKGMLQSFSRRPQRFLINTRQLKARIDGTEFLAEASAGRARIEVIEGLVRVSNERGEVAVPQGQAAAASSAQALPQLSTVAAPREDVQWALYYPPILAMSDAHASGLSMPRGQPSKRSVLEMARGRPDLALGALEDVPASQRDTDYLVYRASIELSIGQVDEAEADLAAALRRDRNDASALALRSVILLVQNRRDEALRDAERAHRVRPSAATAIALSYCQQAGFRIESARETLLDASRKFPSDSLVWARLGEVQLMLGERRQAVESAKRSVDLQPDGARALLVFGFASLAEYRERQAVSAFERAIRRSSADPMAHLGLGLARIAGGDLAGGRAEIEVAVALDSNSALLRAYLGKAYFEEKRYPIDEKQYDIAKGLDPKDPTAFLYSGILKQSVNRPIEALRDIEASAERNGNRAIYRSRLLLDKDRAARTASLGRVMNDLGFNRLGVIESAYSLAMDPASTGGHRYLSDTYRNMRRREISRVSELLQAQLFQDINVNPLQPSLAETSLNIITAGGPATPGFNEFTPLFERNMAQLNMTGFTGTQNTFGGEGILTALYDRLSFSAGAYHYRSDGWRDNNGLDQTIVDALGQAALTPELNIQAEYRRRNSSEGDLAFNFDPNAFLVDKWINRGQQMGRIGLRYSPSAESHMVFSYIHNDLSEDLSQSSPFEDVGTVSLNSRVRARGDQWEGQFIHQRDWLNLIAGLAYSKASRRNPTDIVFNSEQFGPLDPFRDVLVEQIDDPRGYLYTNVEYPRAVTWTLGFSYDAYQKGSLAKNSFNPKFGLQWHPTKDLLLRAAAFKVVQPSLVNNRTIEPTQIAGFNQFFDDIDATQSTRYGVGFNWSLRQGLYVGGETSWRYLDEPLLLAEESGAEAVRLEKRKETFHNLFVYWTPFDRWAFKGEFVYDQYDRPNGIATASGLVPNEVETFSAPLAVSFFDPSGVFATLGGTFVNQTVARSVVSAGNAGSDNFFVVDAAVGYRFPKRLGILDLSVRNLFDTRFRYQDDSYREFGGEPSIGPYFPVRMFLARLTLIF